MTETNKNSSNKWFAILAGYAGIFVVVLCIVGMVIFTFLRFTTYIQPDERGLVVEGMQPTGEILLPGRHFTPPGKHVVIYDIGRQTYTMGAGTHKDGTDDYITCPTLDGKVIEIGISVIYALDPQQLPDLYVMWQDRYETAMLRALSRGTTRETAKAYTFDEIQQNRDEIANIIFDDLESQIIEHGLILFEIDILDIHQVDD